MPSEATIIDRVAGPLAFALACAAAVHAVDAAPVGVFYDDALYVILGKAIASGAGYRYVNIPGAPPATHYPPGYPLLLALLWRIAPRFPENVALFKMVNALFVGVVAAFTFRLARRQLGLTPPAAAAATLAGTAVVPLLVLSSAVMSELLFLALLLPWLLCAERDVVRRDLGRAALLGVTAGALFYVRAHAIVLPAALAAAYLLHRDRRGAAAVLGAGALVTLPWFVWVATHDALIPAPLRGAYGSYGAWLIHGIRANGIGMLFATIRDNLVTTGAIIARSFAVIQLEPFRTIAVLSVLTVAVEGARALYTRMRVTLFFLVAYFAIVMVWPFSPLRFIWGVWPIVILTLAAGMESFRRSASERRRGLRAVGLIASAIALAGMLIFNARGYANAWWTTVSRPIAPRLQPQLQWTATHGDTTTVVAADDEGAIYLYTGRRAVPANVFTADQYFRRRATAEDAANLALVLRTFRPDYVIAWADPTLAAAELLVARPPRALVPVDTIRGGRVFAVTGERTR